MEYEFNILYYINMFKKTWKIILTVIILFASVTFCFSIFSPDIYESKVTLLPLTEKGSIGGGSSTVEKLLGISSTSSSMDTIGLILKSRRMEKDIEEYIKPYKKSNSWWQIMQSGILPEVVVRGSDPDLTEKIANFCIQDLDKLNVDLAISSNKPMVKVLDPAVYGEPESRQIPRKIFVSVMLAFLASSSCIFFADYLRKLKSHHGEKC